MATVRDVFEALDRKAPFSLQMDFDNAGFLVGRGGQEVTSLLVALDVTEEGGGGSCRPWSTAYCGASSGDFLSGQTCDRCRSHRQEAACSCGTWHCCHLRPIPIWMPVADGVNDQLAHALGLQKVEQLHQDGVDPNGVPYGIGRVGEVPAVSIADFASHVKKCLHTKGVRAVDAGRKVHRVAVGGGSCGSMLGDVLAKGCDTFVTADVKYDTFLDAKAQGINLIDAGHFATENVVCPRSARL